MPEYPAVDWAHHDSVTSCTLNQKRYDGPPTRICMICDKLENPNADMAREGGWICPDCKKKIGKLIGVRTDG